MNRELFARLQYVWTLSKLIDMWKRKTQVGLLCEMFPTGTHKIAMTKCNQVLKLVNIWRYNFLK